MIVMLVPVGSKRVSEARNFERNWGVSALIPMKTYENPGNLTRNEQHDQKRYGIKGKTKKGSIV